MDDIILLSDENVDLYFFQSRDFFVAEEIVYE